MIVAVLLAAWHIFASFLWIAPPSPLRQVVPGTALTNYMIPFFGQSWSVFAPEPINGDYTLLVRAKVDKDGKQETTDWVNATKVEISMIHYNLFPPRAGIQSTELASEFKGNWDALTADHKVIVKLGYFNGTDWRNRLDAKLKSYPSANLVPAYMGSEYMITAYSTQVAKAVWGDKVSQVQFQVYRQNVTPFENRNTPGQEPQPKQIADVGWRGLITAPGQSDEDFSSVFKAAYDRLQK